MDTQKDSTRKIKIKVVCAHLLDWRVVELMKLLANYTAVFQNIRTLKWRGKNGLLHDRKTRIFNFNFLLTLSLSLRFIQFWYSITAAAFSSFLFAGASISTGPSLAFIPMSATVCWTASVAAISEFSVLLEISDIFGVCCDGGGMAAAA